MAAEKGFEALTSWWRAERLRVPDIGIVGCAQFEEKIKNLSANSGLPVADEPGFADAMATVHVRTGGAAGLHIEDQSRQKMRTSRSRRLYRWRISEASSSAA